jgi:chitinase
LTFVHAYGPKALSFLIGDDMKNHVLAAVAASALSVATTGQASNATVYAPYIDMTVWPTPILDVLGVQQGIQQFTLAFIVSGQSACVPSWGGVQDIGAADASGLLASISTSLAAYRARGGEVAVSFGGANGVPLMQSCANIAALENAYQKVVDLYSLTHVDFDIEGAVQADTAAVSRNFQAVAALQSAMRAKGKTLHVTLTLPVMPTGLTAEGVATLQSAISNKVVFDAVNVMAMDYGSASIDMGQAAVQAATALYSQLDSAFKSAGQTKTNAQLWQLIGVTPMIGMNDVQGETFSLDNARSLLSNARANEYRVVSNWSVGRDQACPGNGAYTSPTCSGILQQPFAFAKVFRQLSGHWGAGVAQDGSYKGGPSGGGSGSGEGSAVPGDWSATAVYTAGAAVTFEGAQYQAQWWTQGDVPGQSSVWKWISGPTPTWSPSMAYSAGNCVLYQGVRYCAQRWTQGDVPPSAGVWTKAN